MRHLLNLGVDTRIHYPIPIHLQKAACNLGYREGSFPRTESDARRMISLPIYPELTDTEVDYVVQSIRSFFC
jgi:dTDP-4-amino-4,6-dideoxygalactose transaminase